MDDDHRIELGTELRTSRERAGLTKAALAEAIGVTEGRIRQYEKGYESRGDIRLPVNIRPEKLRAMAKVLGGNAGPLLIDLVGPPEIPIEVDLDPHPVGLGLDAEADGLSPDDVAGIREQIRTVKRLKGLE